MTAQDMRALLYRHYSGRCAVLFEVASDPRLEAPGDLRYRARIIDALTVQKARKPGIGPLDLMAIEVKVDRGDFLSDVRDPLKQAAWREIAHRHAYAVPEGLVKAEEVPEGSGLLAAKPFARGGGWSLRWQRRAPYTAAPEIRPWFTLSLAWRMSAAEAKVRGLTAAGPEAETAEDLRAALVRARSEAEKLSGQVQRSRDEARAWRDAYAARGYLPCAHCGKPVQPAREHGYWQGWRHVTAADEGPCAEIRPHRYSSVYPADDADPPEAAP